MFIFIKSHNNCCCLFQLILFALALDDDLIARIYWKILHLGPLLLLRSVFSQFKIIRLTFLLCGNKIVLNLNIEKLNPIAAYLLMLRYSTKQKEAKRKKWKQPVTARCI